MTTMGTYTVVEAAKLDVHLQQNVRVQLRRALASLELVRNQTLCQTTQLGVKDMLDLT
jgi:hypothetical protein